MKNDKGGYVNTGKKILTKQTLTPQTKTDADTQKEASKYVNEDVPGYNKLFIGTIIAVGFLLWNGKD